MGKDSLPVLRGNCYDIDGGGKGFVVWTDGVPIAKIIGRVDEHGIGHVSDFIGHGFRIFTILSMLRTLASVMSQAGAVGVIIHVEGKNVHRYRYLGFQPVPGLPMLLSAPMDVILRKLKVK